MQLQQRTWLMHWALHVFWNTENGKTSLIDLFLQPAYMSAIQINAQHLLRYLAAAVVLNRKRRNNLRDLIKVIQQESYEYSDPITQVGGAALRCERGDVCLMVVVGVGWGVAVGVRAGTPSRRRP
jgi:hypothetical protein